MQKQAMAVFAMGILISATGFAKDKKKNILPAYVLTARTVKVIIDPTAGISIDDPRANEIARADVEAALRTWGRFELVTAGPADLVIVVRKGLGRVVDPTIHDPRQNDPMSAESGVGPENSRPPGMPGSASSPSMTNDRPSPQTEIGGTEDSFMVYRGDVDRPLDTAPVWRCVASDALQPHSVPAVDKFRKAIADAEKAATKGP